MKREFEAGRHVFELRPQGLQTLIAAAALLVMGSGWASGEWFAFAGLRRALATGERVFFGLWLTAWTLGGLFVLGRLLRAVAGRDRIEVDGDGLRRLSVLGPLRAGKAIARERLQGISNVRSGVVARTIDGPVVLTRFGTPADQHELMLELRRQLHLDGDLRDAVGATPDQPPLGWVSEVAPDGSVVLRRARGPLNPLRHEYRLAPGRLETCLGIGDPPWHSFDNPDLAIESFNDSDGDTIYRLVVRHVGGKSEVAQMIDDPYALVQLGRWMSRRIERPLELPRELRERFAA